MSMVGDLSTAFAPHAGVHTSPTCQGGCDRYQGTPKTEPMGMLRAVFHMLTDPANANVKSSVMFSTSDGVLPRSESFACCQEPWFDQKNSQIAASICAASHLIEGRFKTPSSMSLPCGEHVSTSVSPGIVKRYSDAKGIPKGTWQVVLAHSLTKRTSVHV